MAKRSTLIDEETCQTDIMCKVITAYAAIAIVL